MTEPVNLSVCFPPDEAKVWIDEDGDLGIKLTIPRQDKTSLVAYVYVNEEGQDQLLELLSPPPLTYGEAQRIASHYEDRLLVDGGDYGYGGEWVPRKEINVGALADLLHDISNPMVARIRMEEASG